MKTARKCTPRKEIRNGQPTGWWEIQKMVDGKRKKVRVKDGRQARAIANAWNEGREYDGFEQVGTAGTAGMSSGDVRLNWALIERYINERQLSKRVTSAHLSDMGYQLKAFATEHKEPLLANITHRMVQQSVNRLVASGKSSSSVDKHIVAVRGVVEWAARHDLISPPTKWFIEKPKRSPGRLRVLSDDELQSIYQWMHENGSAPVAAYIEALVLTGCRRNEMLHRKPDDIKDGLLILDKTKNGDTRAVPLSPRAKQILTENLPWPFSLSTLRRRVRDCREKLGLEHWVLHSMRHTAATRLVTKGANPAHIQKFLGHRTQAMTNRYTHLQAADIRGIADLIDE
ncbi:MAG: site-specific integrase [Geminicoccaceae bacterium]